MTHEQTQNLKRWEAEHAEWCAIRDELLAGAPEGEAQPLTAFDVTEEQRRRLSARGESSVLPALLR